MKKAADILSQILDQKNSQLGNSYASVFGNWAGIVGESLAEHSRVYEIRNGALYVEIDHPGWMQLLLMKKRQIIVMVRRKYPELKIRDLRARVNLSYPSDSSQHDVSPQEPGNEPRQSSEENRRQVEGIVSEVSDEGLRRRLKRLFLKSIERHESGRG